VNGRLGSYLGGLFLLINLEFLFMSVTVSSQQRVENRKFSNPDSLTMLRLAAWCIFFAATVPTLNFMRYGNVASFWSDVGVFLFVGLGLFFLSL
jgi:hypothetical protein